MDKFALFIKLTNLQIQGNEFFFYNHIKYALTFEEALILCCVYQLDPIEMFEYLLQNKNLNEDFVAEHSEYISANNFWEFVYNNLGDVVQKYSDWKPLSEEKTKKLHEILLSMGAKNIPLHKTHENEIDDETISPDYANNSYILDNSGDKKIWNKNSIAFMTGNKATKMHCIYHVPNFLNNPNFTVEEVVKMYQTQIKLRNEKIMNSITGRNCYR